MAFYKSDGKGIGMAHLAAIIHRTGSAVSRDVDRRGAGPR